jgi:hypothetical protein
MPKLPSKRLSHRKLLHSRLLYISLVVNAVYCIDAVAA